MSDDDDIFSSFDRIAAKIKNLKEENENLKKSLEQERESNKAQQLKKDDLRLEELGKEIEKIFVMFEATQSYFSSLGASITEIKKKLAGLDQSSSSDGDHDEKSIEDSNKSSVEEHDHLVEKDHEQTEKKELSEVSKKENERELLLKKELMGDNENLEQKDDEFFSTDDSSEKSDGEPPPSVPKWLDEDDGEDPFAENKGMDTDEFMKNFNP